MPRILIRSWHFDASNSRQNCGFQGEVAKRIRDLQTEPAHTRRDARLTSYLRESSRLVTREIGIRIALGAQPGAVVRLVLAGQSRAFLVGLSVGALGAVAASVILRSCLYGLSPADPVTCLAVAAALTVAVFVAGYVPARRATSIDAATTLRSE